MHEDRFDTLSGHKARAWALAIGVNVPLAHPRDEVRPACRGSLPDVPLPPGPARRSTFGLRPWWADWFGRLRGMRGRALPAPMPHRAAAAARQETAPAEPDHEQTRLAA